ncbi:MAG TPA: patatin-like phospholipase family protein [Anaeromyxobacter sp.]|nr:patatin-like phospholipase family protein [Anaeromyxobacter sp.]
MSSDADLDRQRDALRPFEEAEAALVRSVVSAPAWISEADEAALRYALNLARVGRLPAPGGGEVDLGPALAPFREEVRAAALPALLARGGPERAEAVRLASGLRLRARVFRSLAVRAAEGRLPPAAVDREVCEKALVVVAGGGGGVVWSYLGAFALLEHYGLAPRLLAGTSMGAVLLLFRARRARWHADDVDRAVSGLSFRSLFRFLRADARYGLPAALRLYLRTAIGDFLRGPDGEPLTLGQLPVPLLVAVTGIRPGALPRDPSYYEHLLDLPDPGAGALSRMLTEAFRAVGELLVQRDRFARIYLGADEETRAFDAVDAVGFSSALPGVIHYDVLREDERMHRLLAGLLERHGVSRLVDGGLVDNLPARAAWGLVQRGSLGTRNAFVLGLEGFGPKLSQPLWFGLGQLAAQNVARNRPFVHLHRSFQRVLSPVEIVPSADQRRRAIQEGKAELHPDMPFLARMVRPFAPPPA